MIKIIYSNFFKSLIIIEIDVSIIIYSKIFKYNIALNKIASNKVQETTRVLK